MRAELTQLPALQHQDPVCHAYGGKPVRDEDGGLAPGQLSEALEHRVLRPGIERRCGFVQNQHLRVPHIRPGQRDLLPLPTRELDPMGKPPPHDLLVALGERCDDRVGQTARCRLPDPPLVLAGFNAPYGNVVCRRQLIPDEILENDPDLTADLLRVLLPQIMPI